MKIKIFQNVAKITTNFKAKDLEALQKYNPEALKLKDDKNNDIFAISYNKKAAQALIENCFVLLNEKHNGFAGMTLISDKPEMTKAEIKENLTRMLTPVATKLAALETQITGACEALNAIQDNIASNITFVEDDESDEGEDA